MKNKSITTSISFIFCFFSIFVGSSMVNSFDNLSKVVEINHKAISSKVKSHDSKNKDLSKITFFSKEPSNEASQVKNNFSSKEFIYAHIDLEQTLATYFNIPEINGKYTNHLNYDLTVFKNGEEISKSNFIWNWCYLSQEDYTKTYFEFDVLPEPTKAKTIISPLEDFSAGKASTPLYFMITPQGFPKTDKYTVEVSIYRQTKDGYGNLKPKEAWPICKGEFEFDFKEDDIAFLKSNSEIATTHVQKIFESKKASEISLPEEWSKVSAPIASGYTELEIKTMISNRYHSSKLNKLVVMPAKGGWVIEKNNLGIPLSKYFNQPLAIFITDSKNNCYYIEGFVNKTYEGGGTYGSVWLYPEKEIRISCDKLKSK